jgi:ribosomal protein S6--L-glutamate ligase
VSFFFDVCFCCFGAHSKPILAMSSKALHFIVLATGQPSRHLVDAITKLGHTFEHHNPDDLYLFISESENGYDRIYNGSSTLENPVRLKAKNYDAVITRIGSNLEHGATILRHLNENLGIYAAQSADGLETASNKLKTTQKLSMRGLRVPLTTYSCNPLHIDFLISKVGGLPAIGKLLNGSQGVGVFILETPQAANTTLESLYRLKANIKIQKFVRAGSKDIRAIVVGEKVVVAMERTGKKDFRANLSQGGSGRKVELSETDKEICIRAAKAVGLDFAGVDIIKDEDGKTYVIEVNGNPGTKIISTTGHNYFIDLVEYVTTKVGGKLAAEQVGSASQEVVGELPKSWVHASWNR